VSQVESYALDGSRAPGLGNLSRVTTQNLLQPAERADDELGPVNPVLSAAPKQGAEFERCRRIGENGVLESG
jgi:hypothetical protein